MYFRFENLEVWQKARTFASLVYTITKQLPREEEFGLKSQMRRAAVSIVSNIAEGSDRKSDLDFARYLRMSLASLEEVVTQLYISRDQTYIDEIQFNNVYKEANDLAAMITSFIQTISGKR